MVAAQGLFLGVAVSKEDLTYTMLPYGTMKAFPNHHGSQEFLVGGGAFCSHPLHVDFTSIASFSMMFNSVCEFPI